MPHPVRKFVAIHVLCYPLDGGDNVSSGRRLFVEKEYPGMIVEGEEIIVVGEQHAVRFAAVIDDTRVIGTEIDVLNPL